MCLPQTRSFGRQLFVALKHLHACEHVHADLKPDNILIGGDKRNLLKVCDFGTAIPFWQLGDYKATRYVQARYYRSPEVVLGLPLSPAMDIWSAACVLFEIFTGTFAFGGASNLEVVRGWVSTLGPVPTRLLRAASFRDLFFLPGRDVVRPPAVVDDAAPPTRMHADVKTRLTAAAVKGKVRSVKAKHPRNAGKIEAARALNAAEAADVACLADLLASLLVFDPAKRLTAEQALRHPFFRQDAKA